MTGEARLWLMMGLMVAASAARAQTLPEIVTIMPTGAPSFIGAQAIPSDDGRFVLFLGTDSLPGVQCQQWYLRDLQARTTELVSRNLNGGPATCPSNLMQRHTNSADISADGSIVVFDFRAIDIHPSETTGRLRTYRYNRMTGQIDLVVADRPGWAGDGGPRIDASGTRVLLQLGYAANDFRTSVVDQGGNVLMEIANGRTQGVLWELSADGQFVVFTANLPQLPPGQQAQLVRKSVATGEEIIVSSNGGQLADSTVAQPSISADGSMVAFTSFAPSLTPGLGPQVLLWTEGSDVLEVVSRNDAGEPASVASFPDFPSVSSDGRYVAFRSRASNFPGGRDAIPSYPQVYVRDRVAGRVSLISRTASGQGALWGSSDGNCEQSGPGVLVCSLQISPRITADGSAVFFHSSSNDLFPANPRSLQAFRFDYARLVGGDFARPVPIGTFALVALLVLMLGVGVIRSRASA